MENLVEIFANTLDAILGIVFLTMILGKKKSMPNWLFVVDRPCGKCCVAESISG